MVVEHDEEIMRASDYLIDVGPDAGSNGGEIVFEGDTKQLNDKRFHHLYYYNLNL
jgi:excinuclease ABC subunit A